MVRTAANKATTLKTEPVVKDADAAVADETVMAVADATDKNVDVKKDIAKPGAKTTTKPKTANKAVEEPLVDSDEIEVISLIPNVSYRDEHTSDTYEWIEAGQSEFMKFGELNRMWRNHRGYMKNMILKPNDERVIKKFGLEGTYDKYDFLMDSENYTKNNIEKIIDSIGTSQRDMKVVIAAKIKDMVISGELSDINVIKRLDTKLGLDLIGMI